MIEELWSGLIEFSEQFIVPDWEELVALIPILLAGLVFVYLAWITYRFATAGPKRRGMRRMPPVTPAGIHMPGPSFAPLLAAVGGFFLVFGTVAGGIWLWVGLAILVITLLYWGREEMRDYGRMRTAGAAGQITAGALPAPGGTPPKGVHIPPPSFRPLLVSIGFTVLVASMIMGGLALVFGFLAVVITAIGWLWDSRREYAATEEADRTGHLDLGDAPAWPKATFAALAHHRRARHPPQLRDPRRLGRRNGHGQWCARRERGTRCERCARRRHDGISGSARGPRRRRRGRGREHHLGRDDADGARRCPVHHGARQP